MQRVITDFGADHAFALVPKKLQEHYGLALSVSTVRAITEYHAGQIYQTEERITGQPKSAGCKILIGEIDGSMIPIVKVDEEAVLVAIFTIASREKSATLVAFSNLFGAFQSELPVQNKRE